MAALAAAAAAGQERPDAEVTFRSDVALVRVDVQVLDRDNRFVPGLEAADFVLREEGRVAPIRSFAREEVPVDVVLLLDVSRSMRPHIEAVAQAAKDAMNVLGEDDRVAIMAFDRSARLHSGFRNRRDGVHRELAKMLDSEDFNGGTDIARGIVAAAEYAGKQGRKDARRAIVIVTDDQTERAVLDERVYSALMRADCVLSLLLAPDAMGHLRRRAPQRGGGAWPTIGLPWPGGGRGPVIYAPGGSTGGGGFGTQPAGTREMAERSGGDWFAVDDAASLERTLERLRQRYALYFSLPPGARAGEERSVEVSLASRQKAGLAGAELRYRRSYVPAVDAPSDSGTAVAGDGTVKRGGWRRAEPGEK